MSDEVLVGIDAGGTTTRALVTTLDGEVLGIGQRGGGNPEHNEMAAAKRNVRGAVADALDAANRERGVVVALTAGLAGLDDESDEVWAEEFLAIDGLGCDPVAVNDAVVAHAGALGSEPGIVVIGGTGSIVLGVDADGRTITNYDFDHYAAAAARHLGRRFAHELLAGRYGEADRPLIDDVLREWDVSDVDAAREWAIDTDALAADRSENALDTIAPAITRGAADGVPIADTVCAAAAADVVRGVDLVASAMDVTPVPIALLGSVNRSEGMRTALEAALAESDHRYEVVEPRLTPVAGAVIRSAPRIDGGANPSDFVDALAANDVCRLQ